MESKLEHILTHGYKEDMISYLNKHPEYFEEAIQLAISDKKPYSWRSAWLLWSCMDNNDIRIQKYLAEILDVLMAKPYNQQRELLQILWKMDLEEEYEGILFDCCVTIWEDVEKQSSVRYRAFLNIIKIAEKHPDLINEVKLLVQEQYLETLTPGAKHAIKKLAYQNKKI